MVNEEDKTTEKPVEINPIEMKDTYLPQNHNQPTYVHQVFLFQK